MSLALSALSTTLSRTSHRTFPSTTIKSFGNLNLSFLSTASRIDAKRLHVITQSRASILCERSKMLKLFSRNYSLTKPQLVSNTWGVRHDPIIIGGIETTTITWPEIKNGDLILQPFFLHKEHKFCSSI